MEIPREIVLAVNLSLLLVISFWAFFLIQYKQKLSRINKEQIEECYLLDCEASFLGNLECREVKMKENPTPPVNFTNFSFPER